MTKAFGYLRVSGKGQKDGDGFERQKQAIKEYAKRNGITLAEKSIFQEVISGTTMPLERPVFTQLLEALLSNGTKIVLVENLSRLARDLMVQETILSDFKARGLQVISVAEPDLAADDPSRKLIRQILGAFHEYEKQMIVLKLRGARERQRSKLGKCEGAKPYGKDDNRPKEAALLQRILDDIKKKGYTANRIAVELNREGIKPRRGQQWHGSNIVKLLRSNGVR